MSIFQSRLDAAAGAATCQFLNSFGSSLVGYGAYSLLAGGTGTVPLALGAAAMLASNSLCTWDSETPGTVTNNGPIGDQCWGTDGRMTVYRTINGQTSGYHASNIVGIKSVAYVGVVNGQNRYDCIGEAPSGADVPFTYYEGNNAQGEYQSVKVVVESGTCTVQGPGSYGTPDPYTYNDPDSGCDLTVHWEGVVVDGSGTPQVVYKIEPAATGVRTGGGVIGGCNFNPTIYVGGGGGGNQPPYTLPAPENPTPGPNGEPWWFPLVEAALTGIIGAVVESIIEEWLGQQIGGKVYRITSACETNSQGEPISQSVEVDIPDLPWDEAIVYRLDAIEHIMQGLKDFRQPICKPQKAVGDLVTVHFESDAPSIAGERPLRKYLRYRDQMASDLAAHAAHWENFAWEAGPVIVSHVGAAWGELQVWAISADEGKNVIRHAGTIAGISPDVEGEWEVTSSGDPRYGMTGTMRLARRKSNQGMVLRISKRGGPDGLPIVPVDPAP